MFNPTINLNNLPVPNKITISNTNWLKKSFKCIIIKHILPFHFQCFWWWFVINSHIYVNKSHLNIEHWRMKLNKSCLEVSFGTNFNRYAYSSTVLCHFQERLSCDITKSSSLNQLLFYLLLAECIRIFTTWQAIPFKRKFYLKGSFKHW